MDKSYYDELDRASMPTYSRTIFWCLAILSQIFGSMFVLLILIWCLDFLGGFSWTAEPKLQFNWHPMLMSAGLLFLGGESMMLYRLLRNLPKPVLKVMHAVMHALAFALSVAGLVAVFDFHNSQNIPNLYSVHSWVGLGAVILFGLQLLVGFIIFLFPRGSADLRKLYMPVHIYFGLAIFILANVAMITGITEKIFFVTTRGKASNTTAGSNSTVEVNFLYSQLPSLASLGNVAAIFGLLFAAFVGQLVTRFEYKRQPLPEEIELPVQHSASFNSVH